MGFEKREIVLVAAVIFMMIGLIPFMGVIYALIIAIIIYFAVRVFVGRRKIPSKTTLGKDDSHYMKKK